jgi:hypothetical protein
MKNLTVILVSTLTLALTSTAFAAGPRLALGPVAGWTNADIDSDRTDKVTHDSTLSWGGMALIEMAMTPQLGIETGAIYMGRKFTIGDSTVRLEREVPTVFAPLELRGWLGNFVSLAAGGFAAFKVGDVKDTVKSGSDTLGTFSSNNRDSTEYGLTAAATLNLAGASKSGLYAEARYMHGLSDNGRSGFYKERIRDVLLSAGFRFDSFGGR